MRVRIDALEANDNFYWNTKPAEKAAAYYQNYDIGIICADGYAAGRERVDADKD